MPRIILLIAVIAAALGACGKSEPGRDGGFAIVTNVYPLEHAVLRVVGEHVNLHNLTPAGVEAHDLELTSDEVDAIEDADLVFYIGGGFQPAVEAAIARRDGPSVDVARGLIRDEDPHFWLDPTLMSKAVGRIEAAVKQADPEGERAADGGSRFRQQLAQLDADFTAGLATCKRRQIVTAHAAFGYLARRYNLTQTAIAGLSPEGEPDPQRIAALSDLVRREGVTTVFYETLLPRRFAETLAKDAGVRTAVLNPLEALTKQQYAAAADYDSVMRENLAALRTALDCA